MKDLRSGTVPTFSECFSSLDAPSEFGIRTRAATPERADADRRDFLRSQLLFWMLAAIDGHAKNFSIFHLAGSAYRLTPRYHILSAYPVMGHGRGKLAPEEIRMAMAVSGKNRHYGWKEIHARHWIATAHRGGVEGMELMLDDFIVRTPEVVVRVEDALPKGFPSKIAETILAGIQQRAAQLKAEMASIR